MAEKTTLENSQAKKERFEFVFSVNGNIICQRYFRINGFKDCSLGSTLLTDALLKCKDYIDNDLKEKTSIYLHCTTPQVFKNREEMEEKITKPEFSLEVPSFIVLDDSEEAFIWNGETAEPYEKKFNKNDYAKSNTEETPCVFKFAFFDEGKEVRSICWDGNVYPKFVRTNIDLSNSRNKYEQENNFEPFGAAIVNQFIASQEDIIPSIVRELCVACSKDNLKRYTPYVEYGDKVYNIDIEGRNKQYEKEVENSYRKRTAAYFREF